MDSVKLGLRDTKIEERFAQAGGKIKEEREREKKTMEKRKREKVNKDGVAGG